MAERKVLYQNRGDGVTRTLIYEDDEPNKFQIFTEMQMDSVLESIKEAQEVEAGRGRATNKHLARVPMTIYEQSIVEKWDEADWKRWLNDPDNKHLRVWQGRV